MAPFAHAVVVGAGGLGCPALLGLVAGGVRRITIVDHDRVETTNLARQILFGPADVGFSKAATARLALLRRAPDAAIEAIERRLAPADAARFVEALPPDTVVLDATDDPSVKFALNDACRRRGIYLVLGAALGTRAQVLGVGPAGACYRCIYEAPPPAGSLPTCDRAGVLSTVVGAAGFLMATVALAGTFGTLHVFDGAAATVRTLSPAPRRDCPACRAARRTDAFVPSNANLERKT